MFLWVKERCFSHLEKESQKNNLLLFVVLVTYGLAEFNVLLNHAFLDGKHLAFLAASGTIFAAGCVLNRVAALRSRFKYIMMTLLSVHAMGQIVLFHELPAVYQVLYFTLALTLIYLNGTLTVYVGAIAFLFTLTIGWMPGAYVPYLEPRTLNIPLGILAETAVVLWAATKIGTRFASILETKERLGRLLAENETQLRIIEKQNRTLETYAFQVEALAREEERSKSFEERRALLKELQSELFADMQEGGEREDESWKPKDEIAAKLQRTIERYMARFPQSEADVTPFKIGRLEEQIREFGETAGVPVDWNIEGRPKEMTAAQGSIFMRAAQDFLIHSTMYRHATLIEAVLSFQTEQIVLTMTDNGDGAMNENGKEIFAHLSERAIEAEGHVEVQSFRGKGAVLSVRLPHAIRKKRKISVVVADPDPFIRESIGLFLGKEEDIELSASFSRGEEVVDYCERQAPDVVVTELDLPDRSGIDATRQLKAKSASIKVVILTHRHEVGSVAEAVESGADAYLLKSADPRGLAASIRYMMVGGTLLSRQTTTLLASQALHHHKLQHIEKRYMSQTVAQEYGLKDRELEILELLAKGKKYKEIAMALYLTEGTVRNYLSAIYAKLNVEDRNQAVEKAIRLGIAAPREAAV